MRAIIGTLESLDGSQRKLAWFARHGRGLYFDIGASFVGSHTSYHVDGNTFCTSPATDFRPRFQGKYVPLDQFHGWRQLGFGMVSKEQVAKNPPVKAKDRPPKSILDTIALDMMPAETINLVVELLHRDMRNLLELQKLQPPEHAIVKCLELGDLLVVVTVLGHDRNLLVRPTANGVQVSHYNDRYSANRPGTTYNCEIYR